MFTDRIKSKKQLMAEERNAKAQTSLNNVQLLLSTLYNENQYSDGPISDRKAAIYVKSLLLELENININQLKTLDTCLDILKNQNTNETSVRSENNYSRKNKSYKRFKKSSSHQAKTTKH